MDIVELALLDSGVDATGIHVERFTPADRVGSLRRRQPTPAIAGHHRARRRRETTEHHAGTTILQTARQVGLSPPSSCESGNCATCMARLVEGSVEMHVNNALTDDEVAEGWILTCQSVPTSAAVHVVYEE